ncbi:jg14252 [Pararge aegeria aegeria]|uniref:Jg14252 protein n=1 Tax=Pararge aegeria aegeria TaxID=348720 RepID=A0A8S4RJE2_9NEOP|nr:jg14252 [Pararge aegeria aegeria]
MSVKRYDHLFIKAGNLNPRNTRHVSRLILTHKPNSASYLKRSNAMCIAQYLEEEFIEDHAKTIRDLAGHTSDLKQFITNNEGKDLSISLFLFDEYLQKIA